ncbi:MAG: hypothetical protein WBR26_00040 [Candidatus Acidiferrum sp.]
MRMSRIGVTFFGAALFFSASAFAGNSDKGTLRLGEKVTVDGTPLSPGNYKVEWNGNGQDVQVTLLQGNRKVATFPAHLTEETAASDNDAYGAANQPNGDKSLTAIYFGGKHYSLQVEPTAANRESQQTNPNSGN